MASVPLKLAIATLLYPPPKEGPHLDADAIKAHREAIALRSLRNACKDDAGKEEMITAILEAAKARGEDVSDEEIKTALGALQATEKLITEADIVSASPSDRDAFLKELEDVDRGANDFNEGALRPDLSQFGVADDAEIPPRLHGAIRGYAWIKGALYSHDEPEWEEGENEPQPHNIPDVISDADADLFTALGMGDVVEAVKKAAKAGVDPLAKARQAIREADPPDRTPPGVVRPVASVGSDAVIHIPAPPLPERLAAEIARQEAAIAEHTRQIRAEAATAQARSDYLTHLLEVAVRQALVLPNNEAMDELRAIRTNRPSFFRRVVDGVVYEMTNLHRVEFDRFLGAVLDRGYNLDRIREELGEPSPDDAYLLETIRKRGLDPETVGVDLLREREEAERARLEAERRAEEARLEAERLAEEARIEAERLAAEEAEKTAAEAAAKAAVKAAAPTPSPAGTPTP